MPIKYKEAILEVLKKSGPLQGAALKGRTLAKLHIEEDDYKKSTYLHHLQELHDEFKIEYKTEDNKRIYFIKEFEHEIPGGLILENLEGRITVPKILKPFNPKIDQGLKSNNKYTEFYFEFNSTNICLSIHKDAFPFNLHISRKKSESPISEEIIKIFGSRTIVLELPVSKISSFKNKDNAGHIFIEILNNDKIRISELGATNPATILNIKNLTPEIFFNDISISGAKTIRNDWVESKINIIEKLVLQANERRDSIMPSVIMLTSESSLLVC